MHLRISFLKEALMKGGPSENDKDSDGSDENYDAGQKQSSSSKP